MSQRALLSGSGSGSESESKSEWRSELEYVLGFVSLLGQALP
jgi:hypothetical protein